MSARPGVVPDEEAFTQMVDAALAAQEAHLMEYWHGPKLCRCGFQWIAQEDWQRHQVEEMLRAALAAQGGA